MLVSCPDCKHQYDAEDLEVGSKFLCHCGIYVRVPTPRVEETVVAHCSSCGGHLAADASSCDFCGSDVAAVDRNLGPVCPSCYCRMLKGASFCSSCGISIQAEKLHEGGCGLDCPRCSKEMVKRKAGSGSFTECLGCGGIWLGSECFDGIVEARDQQAVGEAIITTSSFERSSVMPDVDQVRYVPCPVCENLMNRRNFADISGVVIDWCKGHGYWFDAFELERILQFVSEGGLDRSRVRSMERARRAADAAVDRQSRSAGAGPPPVTLEGFEPPKNIGPSGTEILQSVFDFVGGLFKR
ncbi:MAG: zf-TFIIB domain-containing protein [Planctomycetota bacterium]